MTTRDNTYIYELSERLWNDKKRAQHRAWTALYRKRLRTGNLKACYPHSARSHVPVERPKNCALCHAETTRLRRLRFDPTRLYARDNTFLLCHRCYRIARIWLLLGPGAKRASA